MERERVAVKVEMRVLVELVRGDCLQWPLREMEVDGQTVRTYTLGPIVGFEVDNQHWHLELRPIVEQLVRRLGASETVDPEFPIRIGPEPAEAATDERGDGYE